MSVENEPIKKEEIQKQKIEEKSNEVTSVKDIEQVLYNKVISEIQNWEEKGIYAITFFVYSNEAYKYRNFNNVTSWAISYNTEADCSGAGPFDEERWNYAFWRHNETMIIDVDRPNYYTDMLFDWYAENGITNIGEENIDKEYDERGNYIGKGPVGEYELIQIAVNVALKLKENGVIKEQFGKELPIIIHGLEYADYNLEATKKANPNGEANNFLEAMGY